MLAASQGSHAVLDRSFLPTDHALLIPETPDGRVLFVIPWHGHTLVGTTDVELPSAPVDPHATEAEVEDRLQQLRARLAAVVGEEKAERQLGGFRGLPACGTPEQIVENLRKLEAAGMTYGIFYFPEAAYDRSGIELFEREVIPALAG